MVVSKTFLFILVLCLAHQSLSKPTSEDGLSEGRGIISTIWDWITYPFTWWSSTEPEKPVTEQLIGSTTANQNDVVETSNSNITVWCNDQTCTTMRCDKTGCKNVTCNVYDTNVKGECREYNILVEEEHAVLMPTDATTKAPVHIETTEMLQASSEKPSTDKDNVVVEQPLELEAIISSTVNQDIKDPQNYEERK
ncbi:unnamed protein product [Arctia plantaginis]|nr:unnamed protein product [Arctia plantaginis]